tara:strand:- start:64 stop:324 length:261 start_codon:yes stop_codon:yes gene_type:complete
MITEAILNINPSAVVTVSGHDIDDCTIEWLEGTAEISKSDIKAKITEMETAEADAKAKKATDKASAKAKLIAGEALTEDEANTIVL